jgi:hypothetical protein
MQHTINRVVLQGAVGPPVVKLSPAGPIFAATELQIAETPSTTVTICGIGIDAAAIADTAAGNILRIEGQLTFDHEAQTFYVFADQVRRMVPSGMGLVPIAPSMKTFDRLERVFLPHTEPAGT